MIKVTLTFDYDKFDRFWGSVWGRLIQSCISGDKCISWEYTEVTNEEA